MDANLSSQEYALLDYANRLENRRDGRLAIFFHLSLLKAQHRREHHLRIALKLLEEAALSYNGQIFTLGNHDIILIVRDIPAEAIDEMIVRMRSFFSNDPIASDDEGMHAHRGRFVNLINIEGHYDRFMTICQRMVKNENERQKRLRNIESVSSTKGDKNQQTMSSQKLMRMEEMLSNADLSNFLRRQPIFLIKDKVEPKPVLIELTLSINHLTQALMPEVLMSANPWLFLQLTQTLDQRLLKILNRGDDNSLKKGVTLNMNVVSILNQSFLNLDGNLSDDMRTGIVIELQFIDILADFEGYIFARDFLKERGYRICIDGVSTNLLPFVERKYLGADLVKINSSRLFSHEQLGDENSNLRHHIDRLGSKSIILARCDNEEVVQVGQAMGITLFQGFFLDAKLLTAKKPYQNSANPGGKPYLRVPDGF